MKVKTKNCIKREEKYFQIEFKKQVAKFHQIIKGKRILYKRNLQIFVRNYFS